MTNHSAIRAEKLWKTYRTYGRPLDRLRESLPWNRGRSFARETHALQDIDVDIAPGQCVGLVGGNGAGKSTLLKILTGTTFPSRGRYSVRGNVAALLELGAGFHPNFSGRANIFMNAALMGRDERETKEKFKQILDFSELHKFIDQPIRTYSSGMVARLGFSVAVASDPDILIIDEILAVGDMHFRRKCVDKIMSFREQGKTMFFCSHSLYDVRQICDKVIWLKDGRIQLFDDAVTVTNEYATYENQIIAKQDANVHQIPIVDAAEAAPAMEEHARVISAHIVDPKTGQRRNKFQPGEPAAVRVHIKNGRRHEKLALAIGFTRADGTLCFAPTTQMDGVPIDFAEGVVTLTLPEVKLLSGEFVVPVWLLDAHGVHRFHESTAAENLIVQNRTKELGLFLTEREWRVETITPGPEGVATS
ncbi:MAG: ABC transporter ATP-binding protein [Planctomycetes bacterium]|nr:ABC transporter ATP-binding protein [Planctomycetota bacterium]